MKINDATSDKKVIKMGVPQGTVLGPILFLIYINDIALLNLNCKLISYADDTVLLFEDKNWQSVYKKAESGLCKLKTYLNSNLLTLNVDKTTFITFSITGAGLPDENFIIMHESNCQDFRACTCSEKIKRATQVKYLGLIIDQHLKWKEHIAYLTLRVRKLFHRFCILREIMSKDAIIHVYNALVESILNYGISIWGGVYESNLKALQISQNKILKILFKLHFRFPTNEIYLLNKILNVRNLYVVSCLKAMHYYFPHLRKFLDHHYLTRANLDRQLKTPKCYNDISQRFVTFFGPKLYNNVPPNIKQMNKKKFCKIIKSYILEHPDIFMRLLAT